MCVVRFILVVTGLVLVSGTTPQQDGQDIFSVYAGHDNATGRQYYGVPQAEVDVPQAQVNASQSDMGGFESADFEDADEVDEGMEEFFLENGFVEINNDDFYDYSYTPKKPVPESFLDESSIKENDPVEEDKPVEKATASGKEDELDVAEQEPQLTTVAPADETTEAMEVATETESPVEEEQPEAVDQLDPNLMDHIIPAFVHPINRPSNEWPLNMTQIGNPSKRKPTTRAPIRRRRPQGNRRPQQGGGQNKRRRRRRKPQKGVRRPVVLQGNNKNRKKNRNKNKRPAVGFSPNNLNYESIHKFFASRSCVDCQCGVTTTRRIVGGTITAVNEFPWMALIAYNGSIQCGGTLINDRFVLTAAHCVRGFAIKQFQIRFLEYNRLSNADTTQVIRRAANIYSLDTYRAKTADNDIAAIRLSSPISFATTTVRPICIPKTTVNFVGSTATVAGWGATSENGRLSNILRKAKVPILSNAQCQLVGMNLTRNMLCAGRILQGGIDACQGDSGGPLMVVQNKRYYLAGIVSWGDGCARPKRPGVYTRVTRYLPWIGTFSTGSCSCY